MPTNEASAKSRAKVKVPVLGAVRPPRADFDVAAITLSGPKTGNRRLSVQLRSAITDGTIETTIDGASTLTLVVTDWAEGLLHSELITGALTVTFDGESFTLTKIARQDTSMTLTFEDTAVNLLRKYNKAKKADRANSTRAQFVRSMVQEVTEARIPFMCPEVNDKQPIGKPTVLRMRSKPWGRWLS